MVSVVYDAFFLIGEWCLWRSEGIEVDAAMELGVDARWRWRWMQDGAGGASRMEVRGVLWRIAAKMSDAISTAILAERFYLLTCHSLGGGCWCYSPSDWMRWVQLISSGSPNFMPFASM
jgi:hypothetical protein